MSLVKWIADQHLQSRDHVARPLHHVLECDNLEQTLEPSFRTQKDFTNHDTFSFVNKNHDSDLDLPCPKSKASAKKSHQSPKLECSLCAKSFGSARGLRTHIFSHSLQRTHICSICQKSFKRQGNLTRHALTHKMKPFLSKDLGCTRCPCNGSSSNNNLVNHHEPCRVEKTSPIFGSKRKALQRKEEPAPFPLLRPCFSTADLLWDQLFKETEKERASNVANSGSSKSPVPLTAAFSKNKKSPQYTNTILYSSDTCTVKQSIKKVDEHPKTLCSDKASKTTDYHCNMQNRFPGQALEVNLNTSLQNSVFSVSTSVPVGNQKQNTPIQQSSTEVTLSRESSCSPLQTHQDHFNTPGDIQPFFSQDQTKNRPTLTSYRCLPDIVTRPVTSQRDMTFTNGGQTVSNVKVDTPASSVTEWPIELEFPFIGRGSYSPFKSIGAQTEQQCANGICLNAFTCRCKSKTDEKPRRIPHQNSFLRKKPAVPVDDTSSVCQFIMEPRTFFEVEDKTQRQKGFVAISRRSPKQFLLPSKEKKDTSDRVSAAFETNTLAELPSKSVDDIDPSTHKKERARIHPLQDVNKGVSEQCRTNVFPKASKPSTGLMTDPGRLVMPVSVPVTVTDHHDTNEVNKAESHLQNQNTKNRKRPFTNPLYIPPPSFDVESSPSGCFQSNLRSSTAFFSEHYQNGILKYPPYTPPPMLSPIRPGCGLYFNTFCSPSSDMGQPFSFPEKETSPSTKLLVTDNVVFTILPHINIGNRFQAEIPEIQDQLFSGDDKADLVWKPVKMTKSVSKFLKLACSTAVPGGCSNLEFALHCLHLSRGNMLKALDKLLIQKPQRYLPRYLADYHYAGSDHWSTAEKIRFKKAYRNNKKDFSYIQAMISQKNFFQCVEYYYTWKKRVSFERRRTIAAKTECSIDGREPESPMNEVLSENKTNIRVDVKGMPTPDIQEDSRDKLKPLSQFPCRKCDRVFDKIQSRNAHMRKHCQEVKMAHSLKICEEESAAS